MNIRWTRGVLIALALTAGCTPASNPPEPRSPSAEQAALAPGLKLVRRFGSLDFRHGEPVRRSVFLGDGQVLASAADDAVHV